MNEIIGRTGVGIIGFTGSVTLMQINAILSAIVAILTIVYLIISIKKRISE
ncbi:MAG: hypothetical protein Tp118DCM00d2C30442581_13 [Prokaryotic dsDNA virus sp.]|nr:MAG: hypothetical protein Tp118DCM00d2C30442581_13 [Prokaryotic dsDNA virus sp.]|tara:strand:+ start:11980 stop:12132 length:153 start_codon:yes stop_codon:yes gene_type:complete